MKPLVLLSGGQDSTVALHWALSVAEDVAAVAFTYGQRHEREVRCARKIARGAGVPFEVVHLPKLGSPAADGGPVVPARNAVLLTVAANHAARAGRDALVIGACEADARDFPDCREEFIQALGSALRSGGTPVQIVAPLIDRDKADIFEAADGLGILDVVLEDTLTCYEAGVARYPWGVGCGGCLACRARAAGWTEYLDRQGAG